MSTPSELPTRAGARVAAVVVDYFSGESLVRCVESLQHNGVDDIVVVDNADAGTSRRVLGATSVTFVEPRANLGYGRGVNRGAAFASAREYLLVSNPDVVVHEGAVDALVAELDAAPEIGLLGPTIMTSHGTTYPSVRVFPNVMLATLHALCSPWWPANPWSARYRSPGRDGHVDWVSGAFFVIRRELFERVGGFDERYFMFAEDMELCWRVQRAGALVAASTEALVTHAEGVSRQHAPRAMLVAHHRSAIRFEWHTARGVRRVLAPLASVVLAARLGALLVGDHVRQRRRNSRRTRVTRA